MDLQNQIFQTILEIIKQGGTFGVIGLVVYLAFNISKVFLMLYFLKAILTQLLNSLKVNYSMRLASKERKISLLTEEVSQKLSTTLENLKTDFSDTCKKLQEDVTALKTHSESLSGKLKES